MTHSTAGCEIGDAALRLALGLLPVGRARTVDGSWSTHKVQPFRSRIFRSTSRSATGGRTPPGGWSGRSRAGGGGRPTRFNRVVSFRRGPSIRDSYATFHIIAAWIAEGAVAPGQRMNALHAPKIVRRDYCVRPRRRRVLDDRCGGVAREKLPPVNRDGRAARKRRWRRGS